MLPRNHLKGLIKYTNAVQKNPKRYHVTSFLPSLVKIQKMNGSNILITFVEFQVTKTLEVEKFLNDIRYDMPDSVEEDNVFVSPYLSVWSKVIATGSYILGIFASAIMFSFVKGEVKEQNKTVINMLLVFAYLLVN